MINQLLKLVDDYLYNQLITINPINQKLKIASPSLSLANQNTNCTKYGGIFILVLQLTIILLINSILTIIEQSDKQN